MEILVVLVFLILFFILAPKADKVLQFIYGEDAKFYLRNKKQICDYKVYLFVVQVLIFLFILGVILLIYSAIPPFRNNYVLAFLCIGISVIISAVWTLLARTKREKEKSRNTTARNCKNAKLQKERERFLIKENHIEE